MKKNFLESKLDALKSPPMDAKLDQKPVAKLIVIGVIILVGLGMIGYIATSFVSAYRASTQPGVAQTLDCKMVSSDKPDGDPSHCGTGR